MKKQKIVEAKQDIVDHLNDKYPISLKHNEDLVNRVYARYPVLDKSEVGIIVKAVFSSFRDLLVLGKTLNFNGLFFNAKLLVFSHRKNGVTFPALKVQMSTPPKLRKYEK